MTTLQEILTLMNSLSDKDKELLKEKLLDETLTPTSDGIDSYMQTERFANGRVCVHCGCVHIVRNGHRTDGTQRYLCRDCGTTFVASSNTILAGTKKDIEVWKNYIDCMMLGLSVRKTAERCGIHKNTAFIWRHKVLDALQEMHDSVLLDGIVEADETFFPVSYKGNHQKSVFKMPRMSHHRGSSVHKRGLSTEQVCVPCAVNRNRQSIARVGKLGKVSLPCLEEVFDDKVRNNSVLCTDKEKAYRKFSEEFNLHLVQLEDGQKVKNGIYHIQHINSYHSLLKDFIDKFRGVSTKYLNNYLVWNNLVVYAQETFTEKEKIFRRFVFTRNIRIRCVDIPKRPPLPVLV